ncbi:hypothetical protein TWF481_006966 [Arthrobotrys musiformis]|uniref:Uncharacterized protein n=1 Tax=Arthrobotrys musiformis TaxID=47236 RepID=A0AAV9WB18_9PEZI
MRDLIFLLLSASQLLGKGQAVAVSSPEEILHREHYGISIRDIIDHVYGKPSLRRRSDGESIPECRLGSTPHYQNGTLAACSYAASPVEYNKAVRDIYQKHNRRSLDEAPPVYRFKRAHHLEGLDGKYKINGGGHPTIPDEENTEISIPKIIPGEGDWGPEDDMSLDEVHIMDGSGKTTTVKVELPENWTFDGADSGCYNSGSWAKLTEMAKVRHPWCKFLYDTRNIAAIRFMTFFSDSIDPTKPGRLLRSSDDQIMAFLPGENDIYALCILATGKLIGDRCKGESEDTRGGWQSVRRVRLESDNLREDQRTTSFAWDPNSGALCC